MQPLPRDPWPTHLPPSFFTALAAGSVILTGGLTAAVPLEVGAPVAARFLDDPLAAAANVEVARTH